jgi:hypothetical protein
MPILGIGVIRCGQETACTSEGVFVGCQAPLHPALDCGNYLIEASCRSWRDRGQRRIQHAAQRPSHQTPPGSKRLPEVLNARMPGR